MFEVSEAVTVMLILLAVVAPVVETVKTAEPEPPLIVALSKLATMFELDEVALSETVPVKPFNGETLIV